MREVFLEGTPCSHGTHNASVQSNRRLLGVDGIRRLAMRMRKWEWTAVALFVVAGFVIPRLEAGPVSIVRFDMLMLAPTGNGYASASTAMLAKFAFAVLVLVAVVGLLTNRRLWPAWLLIGVVSGLGYVSVRLAPLDLNLVVKRGNELVRSIESFHSEHGRYPQFLHELARVPDTGLHPGRRFCYVSKESSKDDRSDWFPSARRYLGQAPYVICVPLVPRGTLVYRPDGNYSDLPESERYGRWLHTYID